jgi:hypothetical protein
MNYLQIKIRILAVAAIIFIAFNAAAFTLPFTRDRGFWIAYLFTTLAFVPSVTVSLWTMGKTTLKTFYRWPIMYVTWVYLVLQITSGMTFMSLPAVPDWVGTITGVILLSLCLVICIIADGANAEIEMFDQTIRVKTSFIRSLRNDVEDLTALIDEDKLKAMLKQFAEELRWSDPMSDPRIAVLEEEMKTKTELLASAISKGLSGDAMETCGELRRLLAERNRKCRFMKG